MDRHIVLLLGMHRSGTSLGAQALAKAGLPMGSALMTSPAKDNLDGYWEDGDIVRVQDECLSALAQDHDGIWSPKLIGLDVGKDDGAGILANCEHKLQQILSARFLESPVFGFKDPRTTFLLPLWKRLANRFGARLDYVLFLRRPGDVRESLTARQGLPPHVGELMWLRSLHDVCEFVTGELLVLAYEAWFTNPHGVEKALNMFLKKFVSAPCVTSSIAKQELLHEVKNKAHLPLADSLYNALSHDGPSYVCSADIKRIQAKIQDFIAAVAG